MKFFDPAFWRCWSLVALVLLSACAGDPNASVDIDHDEIITASDEPEARKRARLRLELASGYFEQGQTYVALDELKQALAIDPTYADAYNLRGLVYMRLGENRLAEDSFRKALARNSKDADVMHNYGWLMCQQARYEQAFTLFDQANANPAYTSKAKTWMAKGMCQARAGQPQAAEQSLLHSYEMDPGNPVASYNLASLLYNQGDAKRAQFYLQTLNTSDMANAETLWLGVKVERRLYNHQAVRQLGERLKARYAQSRQANAYEREAFNE